MPSTAPKWHRIDIYSSDWWGTFFSLWLLLLSWRLSLLCLLLYNRLRLLRLRILVVHCSHFIQAFIKIKWVFHWRWHWHWQRLWLRLLLLFDHRWRLDGFIRADWFTTAALTWAYRARWFTYFRFRTFYWCHNFHFLLFFILWDQRFDKFFNIQFAVAIDIVPTYYGI